MIAVNEPERAFVEEVRSKRAELRESLGALELALAVAAREDHRQWIARVHVALVELSADFREHLDLTEGPDGLHHQLLRTAPRLFSGVQQLTEEHVVIKQLLDDLLALADAPAPDVDELREQATQLLGLAVRHRQRGSDLVYEAFEIDIGGET